MEEVVLVDEEGYARGVAEKSAVHHANTPLHLGFSCYVLNNEDQLLLTRRALSYGSRQCRVVGAGIFPPEATHWSHVMRRNPNMS